MLLKKKKKNLFPSTHLNKDNFTSFLFTVKVLNMRNAPEDLSSHLRCGWLLVRKPCRAKEKVTILH